MENYELLVIDMINKASRSWKASPLILGGVPTTSGGGGGPPGGFVGYLPQKRVAYDTLEAATSGIPISGASLYDNLCHIRYRLENLESSSGIIVTDFLSLTDTPATYSGQTGKSVVVNATETGLVFATVSGGSGSTDILMVQVFM